MILSESKDMVFNIDSKRIKITDTASAIFPTVLRPRKSDISSIFDDSDDEIQ